MGVQDQTTCTNLTLLYYFDSCSSTSRGGFKENMTNPGERLAIFSSTPHHQNNFCTAPKCDVKSLIPDLHFTQKEPFDFTHVL